MSERTTQVESAPAGAAEQGQNRSLAVAARRFAAEQVWRRIRNYGPSVVIDILVVTAAFEVATMLRFVETSTMRREMRELLPANLLVGFVYAVISYLFGLHRRLWRYASLKEGLALAQAVAVMTVLVTVLDLIFQHDVRAIPLGIVIAGGMLSYLFLGFVKLLPRLFLTRSALRADDSTKRVLIVGAGAAGAALAARLLSAPHEYQTVAFLDDDPNKWRRRIHDTQIVGPIASLGEVVERYEVDVIAIAIPSASRERISEIITQCQQTDASIKIVHGVHEMVDGQANPLHLREVNIADLLGREVVPLKTDGARSILRDKTVLVTGAAGSIGSELCRQLISYGPRAVVALDNNETGLFDLAESLRGQEHADRLVLRIGDITSRVQMSRLFSAAKPDLIFHAAAYKHVPLLEQHPDQAIRTNVLGTYDLCNLARDHRVGTFVFVSTDKAADPVNVLGASKRAGELVVQTLAQAPDSATKFCAVRFGNVIGSRGSVVPTFLKQIEAGGPVTVTDPGVTRYFMTIPEACGLVIVTASIADKGGLFILDMGEPVSIADVAVKMIRLRGLRVGQDVPIVYTGLRPGEKMHEVLASPTEELLPTRQGKIFTVAYNGDTIPEPELARRVERLQTVLAAEDPRILYDELFAAIRTPVHA